MEIAIKNKNIKVIMSLLINNKTAIISEINTYLCDIICLKDERFFNEFAKLIGLFEGHKCLIKIDKDKINYIALMSYADPPISKLLFTKLRDRYNNLLVYFRFLCNTRDVDLITSYLDEFYKRSNPVLDNIIETCMMEIIKSE